MPKHFNNLDNKQIGQTIIITAVVIMAVSLIVLGSVAQTAVGQIKRGSDLVSSKQSWYAAESALGDTVYRLSSGWSVDSSETYNLYDVEIDVQTNSLPGGLTRVTAVGDMAQRVRVAEAELAVGTGVAFNYGIQAGRGGFELSGSAGVVGNVYSNGDIIGSESPFITGSAFAAGSPDLALVVEVSGSSEPPLEMQFGHSSNEQDGAVRFTLTETDFLHSIEVYLRKAGNPSNLTVRIVTDDNGLPGQDTVAEAALNNSLVDSGYDWVAVEFGSSPTLFAGETYWLVLDGGNHNNRYYYWGAISGSGNSAIGRFGNNWNQVSGQMPYFRLYQGGKTSIITGSYNQGLRIGSDGEGDAHAHTVNNSKVEGVLYCQNGSGNNQSCDNSLPDPDPEPFPIEDSQIENWKAQAEGGQIIQGNVSVGGVDNVELGPAKIDGNLSIGGSGVLTITGTLWVTGNITLGGGAILQLDPLYGSDSGVVIADGRVSLGGSAPVEGSGQAGSYVLLLTTSTCPAGPGCGNSPALNIAGASGAIILNAQRGTINFTGSAHAKEATAHRIVMSGATTVTYESGLANINFTSGPSGGPAVVRWREVE